MTRMKKFAAMSKSEESIVVDQDNKSVVDGTASETHDAGVEDKKVDRERRQTSRGVLRSKGKEIKDSLDDEANMPFLARVSAGLGWFFGIIVKSAITGLIGYFSALLIALRVIPDISVSLMKASGLANMESVNSIQIAALWGAPMVMLILVCFTAWLVVMRAFGKWLFGRSFVAAFMNLWGYSRKR